MQHLVRSIFFSSAFALCCSAYAAPVVSAKDSFTMTSVSLPADSDFSNGSFVLTSAAQQQLGTVLSRMDLPSVNSIVINGFANAASHDRHENLATERGRSVKAFMMLSGVEADRIHVDAGKISSERPGSIVFDITQKQGSMAGS